MITSNSLKTSQRAKSPKGGFYVIPNTNKFHPEIQEFIIFSLFRRFSTRKSGTIRIVPLYIVECVFCETTYENFISQFEHIFETLF
jgi:hypothetical protein